MIGELRSSLRYCLTFKPVIRSQQPKAPQRAGNEGAVTQEPWEALIAAVGIRTRESRPDERLRPEGDHEYSIGRSRARGGI